MEATDAATAAPDPMFQRIAFTMFAVEDPDGAWTEYDLPGGGCLALFRHPDPKFRQQPGGAASVAFEIADLDALNVHVEHRRLRGQRPHPARAQARGLTMARGRSRRRPVVFAGSRAASDPGCAGMASPLQSCFDANQEWATRMRERDPNFFDRLKQQQRPELLWIGCADSRLPPDRIINRQPGEVFVHRNVANVVVHTDMNCLSVLQYGIEVLGIQHVIVCGHYGCGGVRAAMQLRQLGLIDNWLRHIRDVHQACREEIDALPTEEAREDRLCELNVAAQVANVCTTSIVQGAWAAGRPVTVHGWIYAVSDGRLRDLDLCVAHPDQVPNVYR